MWKQKFKYLNFQEEFILPENVKEKTIVLYVCVCVCV